MDVTVIVCTRDRPTSLRRMLNSACQLTIPPELSWELLIVDNSAARSAFQIAAEFLGRLPLRLAHEPEPGLSKARNRAVSCSGGQYLCWTDDDVVLDRGWLEAYVAAFQRHPEAALFGGRVAPLLEPPSPKWFAAHADRWPISGALARRDWVEETELDYAKGHIPWGANYAIRAVEQRLFAYDPELGASPRCNRLGEETDLFRRVLGQGARGWWAPDSLVTHCIGPERQTLSYLYRYYYRLGETVAFQYYRARPHADTLGLERALARPDHALRRRAMVNLGGFVLAHVFGVQTKALRRLASFAISRGILEHRRILARQRRSLA